MKRNVHSLGSQIEDLIVQEVKEFLDNMPASDIKEHLNLVKEVTDKEKTWGINRFNQHFRLKEKNNLSKGIWEKFTLLRHPSHDRKTNKRERNAN